MGPSAALTTRIAPVHLRGAGDHVLHIIRVARAVNVRIVPVVRLVLDVADRDRHDLAGIPAPLTLARLRHFVIADEFRHPAIRADLGQRTRQRRLAMVHVPDRPDVHVGLSSLKLRLRHPQSSPNSQNETLYSPRCFAVIASAI